MIVTGAVLAGSWFVEPLRELWPVLLALPLPIRIGLTVAAIGFMVILATIIHDRLYADRASLREELGDDSTGEYP